ncbi:MAG: hypothetical protein GXO72_03360 [Caldiserica bacterium]|nr:hypothetical protein [Caldisericota bacterium]
MVPVEVYHASRRRGLRVIRPRRSTHGRAWVYATADPVLAACFLGNRGGDFTCAVGRDPGTGRPFICERFAGAFELRYRGVRGSIYVLPGEGFRAGETGWEKELVCPRPVVPLREIPVEDAAEHLLRLEREGKLLIARYPAKIGGIPEDDEDLVRRAVIWYRRFRPFGFLVLRELGKYHPHLVARAREAIRAGRYAEDR